MQPELYHHRPIFAIAEVTLSLRPNDLGHYEPCRLAKQNFRHFNDERERKKVRAEIEKF
jgi:hypothetical protein